MNKNRKISNKIAIKMRIKPLDKAYLVKLLSYARKYLQGRRYQNLA